MKFANTINQSKTVKEDAKTWGKATIALTKSISKMPGAIGKDISTEVKTAREARKAFEEWKKSKEPDAEQA